MNAVALLAQVRAAGVDVRVVDGDIRLRGRPEATLVQSVREAKPALVRLLTGRNCYRCGAAPGPLETGGYDLAGWRCDRCLDAAGLFLTWPTHQSSTAICWPMKPRCACGVSCREP